LQPQAEISFQMESFATGVLSRLFPSILKSAGLIVLFLSAAAFCQVVKGQGTEGRAIPRMITANPTYSRARRVNSEADTDTTVVVVPHSPVLIEANLIEKRAFEETNRERAKNGLPALVWDAALCEMARHHSEDMAKQGYFSHVSSNGKRLRERARSVGIDHYQVLGENIAYNLGYDDPGAFAVERWMVSPGHRANILSTAFKAMATGSYVAADGSVYLTQSFIAR
jgi:uncharacterized protein YkwD